jgi:cytochrome P450
MVQYLENSCYESVGEDIPPRLNSCATKLIHNQFFHSIDVAEHAFLRKRVASAYSMSTILALEPGIQDVSFAVWEKLDEAANHKRHIDMHEWASYFAFDVVGKLTLGAPIGFIDQAKDVSNIIKSIHGSFWLMATLGYVPGQMKWVYNPISNFILSVVSAAENAHFPIWVKQQLDKRRAEPKDSQRKRDMLDHFVDMKERDGRPASDPSIFVEVGNIIGAGADTTSIGIRTVLAQLILHPEDYLRVQEEVDEAFSELPKNSEARLPYLVAEKLQYLNACVKEALRLHPSILWQLPREAPAEGVEIAGYYIPPSATISMSPIAQNRDRRVFGPSADEWRPARWVPSGSSSDEEIRQMEKYNVTVSFGNVLPLP